MAINWASVKRGGCIGWLRKRAAGSHRQRTYTLPAPAVDSEQCRAAERRLQCSAQWLFTGLKQTGLPCILPPGAGDLLAIAGLRAGGCGRISVWKQGNDRGCHWLLRIDRRGGDGREDFRMRCRGLSRLLNSRLRHGMAADAGGHRLLAGDAAGCSAFRRRVDGMGGS